MMVLGLLLIAQAASAEPLMARYYERTRADVPCIEAEASDIVVSGRRKADGDRVPLLEPAESDRDRPLEYAARLLDGRTAKCGITSRVLSGCGMVGVSARVGFDGKVTRERPLAP